MPNLLYFSTGTSYEVCLFDAAYRKKSLFGSAFFEKKLK